MNKLVGAWLKAQNYYVESDEYEKYGWAVDELYDLSYKDPAQCLNYILEILHYDSSEKVVGALGAGVIEDLLVHHAMEFIDKIVELSQQNTAFRNCLNYTFIDSDDVTKEVYDKLQSIRGR